MDIFAVIFIYFSLALTASGFNFQRRCLLFNGQCVSRCPLNMHPYHTRCDQDTISQRTCTSPFTYPIGYTCGWSRCDCNGDMLLSEDTNSCVTAEDCPPLLSSKKIHPRGRKKVYKVPKNMGLRVIDDGDLIDIL